MDVQSYASQPFICRSYYYLTKKSEFPIVYSVSTRKRQKHKHFNDIDAFIIIYSNIPSKKEKYLLSTDEKAETQQRTKCDGRSFVGFFFVVRVFSSVKSTNDFDYECRLHVTILSFFYERKQMSKSNASTSIKYYLFRLRNRENIANFSFQFKWNTIELVKRLRTNKKKKKKITTKNTKY